MNMVTKYVDYIRNSLAVAEINSVTGRAFVKISAKFWLCGGSTLGILADTKGNGLEADALELSCAGNSN